MRIKFSKTMAAVLAGILLANLAGAHPGHGPTDVAAQVSQPLAGADHFAVFLALTSVLLLVLRVILKSRGGSLNSPMQRARRNKSSLS